jgi:type VI secretion system protein ImpH
MSTNTALHQKTYRYIQRAQLQPWDHGFTRMLRWFGARYHFLPRVGTAAKPSEEVIRIGQSPSLTFSPRELAEVSFDNGRTRLKTYGLGLWGPNGPLPLHFSEIAQHRNQMQHDHTLTNFVDIFHHRSLSLFHRAWEINQSTAGLDRQDDEQFSRYLAWLTGGELSELATTNLPTHAQISASAHLKHQSKNPSAMAQTLAHYFQVPVALEEYYFNWMDIDVADRTQLGRGENALLGQGALLGECVPDRQNAFLLTLGPLSLSQYLRFLPNGEDLGTLIDWVRAFIGLEYKWVLKLLVEQNQAAPVQLGGNQRLGWSTWLGGGEASKTNEPVVGMMFEPEQYMSLVQKNKRTRQEAKINPLAPTDQGITTQELESL